MEDRNKKNDKGNEGYMITQEYMNIVIGSSKEHALFTMVLLESLFENNQGESFNIYYYYDEPINEILSELKVMTEKAGSKFIPMFVSDERKKNLVVKDKSWWHCALWYRYYCVEDLCHNNDRALLLGTDTIIQKKIKDFYYSDMNGKGIIAVTDMGNYYNTYRSIDSIKYGMSKDEYINSDVLLLDFKKLDKKINVQNMIDLCISNRLWALDQDTLNFFYHDLINVNHNMEYNFIPAAICEVIDKKEYNKMLSNAIIVHYAAKKPWNEYNLKYSHDLWFEYAKKTACYEEILKKTIELSGKKIIDDKQQMDDKMNKIERELRKHIFKMDKLFWIQDLLWYACEDGTILQNLGKYKIKNIAIYGYGKIGKHLLRYCKSNDIPVLFIVDSSKSGEVDGIPIVKLENIDEQAITDAIIVTPIQDFEEIKAQINNLKYLVMSLEKIVEKQAE